MKKEKEKGITITLVGKQEPNIINNWLDENGIIEIAKQVEKEAKDLCEQETLEEDKNGTIIQFLCGSHSYDGVWFGDKHPYREGNFWWRSILQEQDKNKYSEEEVINIIFKFSSDFDTKRNIEITLEEQKQWFEQFKKK
jgi:hypothetical protein